MRQPERQARWQVQRLVRRVQRPVLYNDLEALSKELSPIVPDVDTGAAGVADAAGAASDS